MNVQLVKLLHDKTGLPLIECKRAAVESGGDLIKAKEILLVYLKGRSKGTTWHPGWLAVRDIDIIFKSLTEWQAENYIVSVQAGLFATREKAAAFGNQPMKLVRDGNRLVLCDKTGKELDEAFDENISVFKLKDSAKGKFTTTHDDYEQVNILIDDFENYAELSSFGSLSYGVNEVVNQFNRFLAEQTVTVSEQSLAKKTLVKDSLSSIVATKEIVEILANGETIIYADIEAVRCAAIEASLAAKKLNNLVELLESQH